MITLIKLKKTVNDLLKSFNIRIYGSEVKEGFIRPSFFVQLLPLSGDNLFKKDLIEKSIMVEINYFSKEKTDLENFKMAEKLEKLLFPILDLGEQKLLVKNFESGIVDGVLSTKFHLNWFDSIESEEKVEKIKDIEIKI